MAANVNGQAKIMLMREAITYVTTGWLVRMPNRKWREDKLQLI